MVYTKKLAMVCGLCVFSSMLLVAEEQVAQQPEKPVEQVEKKLDPKDNPLAFVDVKFEDFLSRVVAQDTRAEFNTYYTYFLQKTQGMTETDIRKVKAVYFDKAITMLEKEHPEWLTTLKPYYNNPIITLDPKFEKVRMVVGSFLVRCGVYSDYCERKQGLLAKNAATTGVWETVKSYVASAGNTVAGWFGLSGSSAKQVTA